MNSRCFPRRQQIMAYAHTHKTQQGGSSQGCLRFYSLQFFETAKKKKNLLSHGSGAQKAFWLMRLHDVKVGGWTPLAMSEGSLVKPLVKRTHKTQCAEKRPAHPCQQCSLEGHVHPISQSLADAQLRPESRYGVQLPLRAVNNECHHVPDIQDEPSLAVCLLN